MLGVAADVMIYRLRWKFWLEALNVDNYALWECRRRRRRRQCTQQKDRIIFYTGQRLLALCLRKTKAREDGHASHKSSVGGWGWVNGVTYKPVWHEVTYLQIIKHNESPWNSQSYTCNLQWRWRHNYPWNYTVLILFLLPEILLKFYIIFFTELW